MKLLQGDCLEQMKQIPDGSIDMVLCDPPYGTTCNKWDTVIPFAPLWEQWRRVVAPRGTIVLFGSEPFSTQMRNAAMDLYKYDWIWVKNNSSGFVHAKNMPMKKHEIISVFSKGSIGHKSTQAERRMTYNPQGIIPDGRKEKSHAHKFGNIAGVRPSLKSIVVREWTNYPTSLLMFPKESISQHTTQKPVALLEYLIKTYTNEGDVVLDNTMGSGSTGVACVNTGREFIGIEMDKHYFDIAEKRIAEAQAQQKLPLAE